jgi:hypothetical protein
MTISEAEKIEYVKEQIGGFDIKAGLVFEYLEKGIDQIDGSILGGSEAADVKAPRRIYLRQNLMRMVEDFEAIVRAKIKERDGVDEEE